MTDFLLQRLVATLGDPAINRDVLDTLTLLAPDDANKPQLLDWLRLPTGLTRSGEHYELRAALRALARLIRPKTYLEIGVRRGWSLAQVLCECPAVEAWAVDTWIPDYAGAENPGPQWVRAEMHRVCPEFRGRLTFVDGDSHKWLPQILPGRRFDLITVDGDHTGHGAWLDLRDCLPCVAMGGALVFDDLVDASDDVGQFTLRDAWEMARQRFAGFHWLENPAGLVPLGIALRVR